MQHTAHHASSSSTWSGQLISAKTSPWKQSENKRMGQNKLWRMKKQLKNYSLPNNNSKKITCSDFSKHVIHCDLDMAVLKLKYYSWTIDESRRVQTWSENPFLNTKKKEKKDSFKNTYKQNTTHRPSLVIYKKVVQPELYHLCSHFNLKIKTRLI